MQFCALSELWVEPFALILADDFLTYSGDGITADLVSGYEKTGKRKLVS
jgi:UTP--glucose-1-phosphate uridylyltransferase